MDDALLDVFNTGGCWDPNSESVLSMPNPQHALLGAILKIINARDEITIRKKK
jgi:hypothetical protein